VGSGGGIGRSGRFFPPARVLAARADNDDDEDGRIIVEETREKTHLLHLLSRWSLPLYKARAGA
jgi:hypothetical protein